MALFFKEKKDSLLSQFYKISNGKTILPLYFHVKGLNLHNLIEYLVTLESIEIIEQTPNIYILL